MITLEVRRHSLRKEGAGSQLSQEGVDLARRIGASMGPFAVVATSVVPRARETALAMGFAVDRELVTLTHDADFYAEVRASPWWTADQPFVQLAVIVAAGGPHYRYAHAMAALWRDLVMSLSDGESALVIGHSGELEATLVACLPQADHATWGTPFAACEGGRLSFGGSPPCFSSVELLRSPLTAD